MASAQRPGTSVASLSESESLFPMDSCAIWIAQSALLHMIVAVRRIPHQRTVSSSFEFM